MNSPPVILLLNAAGAATADRIAAATGGEIHGLAGRANAPTLFEAFAPHAQALFIAGRPIIGVCAAGALIRAVAPILANKWREPAVIAVSPDGRAVVPLLGGHHGANGLAQTIAAATGAAAAVTTASEAEFGRALDEPPEGWRLDRPDAAKAVTAAALSGAPIEVRGDAGWAADLAVRARARTAAGAPGIVEVAGGGETLVFAERRAALGLGAARNADPAEMRRLVEAVLAEAGLPAAAVGGVFTIDLKADEAAINAAARALDAPLRLFDAEALEAETPRVSAPSETVFREVGAHSVAEAAALRGAGPDAVLRVPKRKTAACTAALALAPAAILEAPGRKRGRLALVGTGPGRADQRTPEATRLAAEAEELIGYGPYIELLGPIAAGKTPRRAFKLGEEEARCRYALERAGEGASVALICSGDPSIYAMGALVLELLDRAPEAGGVSNAARRAELILSPGVSALQAASARAGALLGHDFCAISLSDLLTPWETIEARIRAAAAGDFVAAFYNPVSERRRWQLGAARDILLGARPAATPVLLARQVGRPEETLRYRELGALSVDEVDMLTVVLVGSSQSRAIRTGDGGAGAEGWRLYTPRGYAKKMDEPSDGPA